MQIREIDINKILIIIFVGLCAVLSVQHGIENIPALTLGGLIGYLSKDFPLNLAENNQNTNDSQDPEDTVDELQ